MTALWLVAAMSASGEASWPPPLQPDEVPVEVFIDRAGFSELIIQNSIFGGFAGFSLAEGIFGSDDPLRVVAGFQLGIAVGALTPVVLLRGKPIHQAQAAYYNLGERIGFATGALVPALWNSRDDRVYYASLGGFFLLGLGTAVLTYPQMDLTPGQVSALGTGYFFGGVTAGLTMLLFDVVPDNRTASVAPVLFFANVGLAASYLLRDRFDVDRRRVIWTDIGGLFGAATGLGAGFLITGGDDISHKAQLYGGLMLAGLFGGALLGYALSDGLDEYKRGVDLNTVSLEGPSPTLLPPLRQGEAPKLGFKLVGGAF